MVARKTRRLDTQQALNAEIKAICDIMRRSNCASALQYIPELTWMLFLRILDEREQREAEESAALGVAFTPSLSYPSRWRDWASPRGARRRALQMVAIGGVMSFANH